MEKNIKFAEKVMLIDASYIDKVGMDLKKHFEPIIQRQLPKADLPLLLEYMAIDAGIRGDNNEVQVIFIHESHSNSLTFCSPSCFADELHEQAFRGALGEFSLYSYQTSELAPRESLYKESIQLLCESKDVKKIILVPDENIFGDNVYKYISKEKEEMSVVFGMNPPRENSKVKFEMVGFALLQAFGIKSEEL